MIMEVIVQNKEEAIEAEKHGAYRLELVSAMAEGGLTPSYGTIKQVLESVSIPVQIMIRPHSYHFNYTKGDLEVIYEDVRNVLSLGGTGIVFGALNADGTVNTEVLQEIIQISPKLDITFHRAFDEVSSLEESYHALVEFKDNVRRILTSGGEANCELGAEQLKRLVQLSKGIGGPEILVGAGLTSDNVETIHQVVHADQYHFGKAVRIENSFANMFDKESFEKIKVVGGR